MEDINEIYRWRSCERVLRPAKFRNCDKSHSNRSRRDRFSRMKMMELAACEDKIIDLRDGAGGALLTAARGACAASTSPHAVNQDSGIQIVTIRKLQGMGWKSRLCCLGYSDLAVWCERPDECRALCSSRPSVVPQALDGLRCPRTARPEDVSLTMERPFTRSTATSPRSFASSQTGSLGHEVRQASMTSP